MIKTKFFEVNLNMLIELYMDTLKLPENLFEKSIFVDPMKEKVIIKVSYFEKEEEPQGIGSLF